MQSTGSARPEPPRSARSLVCTCSRQQLCPLRDRRQKLNDCCKSAGRARPALPCPSATPEKCPCPGWNPPPVCWPGWRKEQRREVGTC